MLTTYETPPIHYAIIDSAGKAPTTTEKYKRAIDHMIAEGIDPRNQAALAIYGMRLSGSERGFLKAALKLLTKGQEIALKTSASADNLAETQAQLYNLDAMNMTLKANSQKGKKSAIWLTPAQVEEITTLPDRATIQGRRDWVVISTMLGAGLRRSEMASLTFDQLKRQPKKNGQLRGVLDVTGKGDKTRNVPISPILEERLKEWQKETGGRNVARSINKSGKLSESLSDKAINDIVHKYGSLIGLPELEAHDLRRTWAQLGLNAGIPITQISALLGHASIKTTQDYLDLHINLDVSISDFVPLFSGD